MHNHSSTRCSLTARDQFSRNHRSNRLLFFSRQKPPRSRDFKKKKYPPPLCRASYTQETASSAGEKARLIKTRNYSRARALSAYSDKSQEKSGSPRRIPARLYTPCSCTRCMYPETARLRPLFAYSSSVFCMLTRTSEKLLPRPTAFWCGMF